MKIILIIFLLACNINIIISISAKAKAQSILNSNSEFRKETPSPCVDYNVDCKAQANAENCKVITTSSQCCASCAIALKPKTRYSYSETGKHFVDSQYYRLGSMSQTVDRSKIKAILDAITGSIKNQAVLNNLAQDRPVYFVSNKVVDFPEFKTFDQMKIPDQSQFWSDYKTFATKNHYPGFINIMFNGCLIYTKEFQTENQITLEFFKSIYQQGLGQDLLKRHEELYQRLKGTNNQYDTNGIYAFLEPQNFFAEMSQVFFNITSRTDTTGRINYLILKTNLPDMLIFLNQIYDNVKASQIQQLICSYGCKEDFCPKPCGDNPKYKCVEMAKKNFCKIQPTIMAENCKFSCGLC